jgi:sugar/nucleoside kinase (ribokinase family)
LKQESKFELLCIGNAMMDVFANADAETLLRWGINDPVQHIPSEKAEQIVTEINARGNAVISSGGGSANVAKIASLLGIKTAFSGCAGEDDFAGIFEKELAGAGVSPILFRGRERTGTCLILKGPNGETRIAAAPGAAMELTEKDISEDLIDSADVIVLDGYVLDRRPLVRRVLELADKHGIPIALDAASVFQIKQKTEEILQYSRNYPIILFMNADEAIAFYNTIRKAVEEDPSRTEREKEEFIIREVCSIFKILTEGENFPIIAVKMGGRGAAIIAGGNIYRNETSTVIPQNNIGAGDAFCAAFLAAWVRGKSISECANFGNRTAREVLDVHGTQIEGKKLAHIAKTLK